MKKLNGILTLTKFGDGIIKSNKFNYTLYNIVLEYNSPTEEVNLLEIN